MMMLTSEQKVVVRCDDNVMLTACPGSGKTRVIVSKLFRVVDVVWDTPSAVACIRGLGAFWRQGIGARQRGERRV